MLSTREAEVAPNVWDLQAKDFIDSINVDFYITILRYEHYWNRPFHTKDLSVLQLLSIAECYLLSKSNNTESIITPLNVNKIMDVVRTRLKMSSKYGTEAEKCIRDMLCGSKGRAYGPQTKDAVVGDLEEGEEYEGDAPDSGLTIDPDARESNFL